jgi:hypothetical protein
VAWTCLALKRGAEEEEKITRCFDSSKMPRLAGAVTLISCSTCYYHESLASRASALLGFPSPQLLRLCPHRAFTFARIEKRFP